MNAFTRQLETQQYKPALALIETLLTELRRLDDKMILTEVHLLESRVYRGIGNLAKAKVRASHATFSLTSYESNQQSSLTSARTAANSIYCPPQLQAALDLQSGILHAEDKDYTTAYSYFYETFENLSSQDDPSALGSLKYMLLCKVMLNLVRVSLPLSPSPVPTATDDTGVRCASRRTSTRSCRSSSLSNMRNSVTSKACALSRVLIKRATSLRLSRRCATTARSCRQTPRSGRTSPRYTTRCSSRTSCASWSRIPSSRLNTSRSRSDKAGKTLKQSTPLQSRAYLAPADFRLPAIDSPR